MTDHLVNSAQRRYFFIINPLANNGRALHIWAQVNAYLSEQKIAFDFAVSESEAHMSVLAKEAAGKGFVVVGVGGDGTISKIACVLAGSNTLLGMIPAGTGNDFARTFSIPSAPLAACDVVLQGFHKAIDVGLYNNGSCFCNVAGVGVDAEVVADVNNTFKKRLGSLAYLAALLKQLVCYRPQTLSLVIDEQEFIVKAWLVAIANGRYYGSGMKVAPRAEPDDGMLDVIIVGELHRLHFLRLFPLVYRGSHIHHSAVRVIRGKQIVISSLKPLAVQADGDICGATPLSVTIAEKALQLLIPRAE